jgi:ABC-type nitrate/sulfonate/bicarbonate transport system permease component
MGVSRIARGIFDPPIEFYRPLPPLAYLPLIVIWFGIEETAKVILIYLACFAPLAMAARAGVKSVMIEQINAAYSMGASKWQVIWHVVILRRCRRSSPGCGSRSGSAGRRSSPPRWSPPRRASARWC